MSKKIETDMKPTFARVIRFLVTPNACRATMAPSGAPMRLWCLILVLLLDCHLTNTFLSGQDQKADSPGTKTDVLRSDQSARGKNAAIVTGSPESRDAGILLLQDGGNAIDAAIASMLVQSVVENHLFCFGSEVPIIIYSSERKVVEVIAGLGAARV